MALKVAFLDQEIPSKHVQYSHLCFLIGLLSDCEIYYFLKEEKKKEREIKHMKVFFLYFFFDISIVRRMK